MAAPHPNIFGFCYLRFYDPKFWDSAAVRLGFNPTFKALKDDILQLVQHPVHGFGELVHLNETFLYIQAPHDWICHVFRDQLEASTAAECLDLELSPDLLVGALKEDVHLAISLTILAIMVMVLKKLADLEANPYNQIRPGLLVPPIEPNTPAGTCPICLQVTFNLYRHACTPASSEDIKKAALLGDQKYNSALKNKLVQSAIPRNRQGPIEAWLRSARAQVLMGQFLGMTMPATVSGSKPSHHTLSTFVEAKMATEPSFFDQMCYILDQEIVAYENATEYELIVSGFKSDFMLLD